MLKLSLFVNLALLVYKNAAYSYDCSDTNLCKNTNIECLSNEDCFIQCNGEELCQNSQILCPLTGNCNIECRGDFSCQNTIINATNSLSGKINILCGSQSTTQECQGLTIYGSNNNNDVQQQQQNDLLLKCNGGNTKSCYNSNIKCPQNGDCSVECLTIESCKNNTITGPINGDLTIKCNGQSSCVQSIFNAFKSDEFDLIGCSQRDSCLDLTIYCPPNTNQSNKNCFIQGNDNLGSYSGRGINLYAINGWHDVDITYSGSYGLRHEGTMYCGDNYDSQCKFASSSWSCEESDAFCNNVITETEPEETEPVQDIDTTKEPSTIIIEGTYDKEGIDYPYYTTYGKKIPPKIEDKSFDGALGMILVGASLIALAFGCVVCGTIRKQLDKAQRKLSNMGFKSPFKSPYRNRNNNNISRIEHSMESYSHGVAPGHGGHGSSHGGHSIPGHNPMQQGIYRVDTQNSNYTYTANIHRPESHSNTRTAKINRPNSTLSNISNQDNVNYNNYGQNSINHLGGAHLGVHGHSGHNNKGYGHGNDVGHGHGHGHGHHPHQHSGSASQHQGHNKKGKHSNTEMIPIR